MISTKNFKIVQKKLEYSFLNPNSGITNYKRQSNGQLVSNGRQQC